MRSLEDHCRLVGILNLVWAGFAVSSLSIWALLIAALRAIPGALDHSWLPLPTSAAFGIMVIGLFILFFVPGLIGGIGILRGKLWSRNWLVISAIVNLIYFPVGTALGVYTLWAARPLTASDVTVSGI